MRALFLGLGLMAAALSAQAGNGDNTVPPDQPKLVLHQDWLKLAANEAPADDATTNRASVSPPEVASADHDWFTPNKVHKYLGLGSLGLVGLALLAPKPGDEDKQNPQKRESGIHHDLAVGATVLGAAAVATGFAFHYQDIDLSKGFKDPDNLHMLLGTLAEIAFIAAVNKAPAGGHAGEGIVGAVAMATAIKIEW